MDNAYGTGSYDLIASRPDNWQQMSVKYGYEYNPDNLGTYESQRDALLKGMGDASKAIGAISGDISTMTKIINLYYLTEDSTGHTRLDYMSAAFKNAFDALKASSGNFSTGMSTSTRSRNTLPATIRWICPISAAITAPRWSRCSTISAAFRPVCPA